jgi:hypothetical protein
MKRVTKATAFDLKVEFDRETDGRWIADIPALPGVSFIAAPASRRSQR